MMKPDYNPDNPYIKNLDEYMLYLLGLVMADGYVTYQNGCYKMRIALNIKDRDIIDKLYNHFKVGSICVSTDDSGYKEQTRIIWTVYEHDLVHGLMYLEVEPRKTEFEVVPLLHPEQVAHFLRGFLDGDGYVYCAYSEKLKRNIHKIGFISNFKMLESINKILEEQLSIKPKKIRKNGKSDVSFIVELSGAEDLKKIYEFLYSDSNIYLDRKYNEFTKLYKGLLKKGENYHGRVY